jgi:WXXGXW repeat (2 copies)
MKLNRGLSIAVLIASATLTACASRPYGYYRVPPPLPPPAYGGYRAAPGPGYVWTEGFYDLRGDRWVWVSGRYMRPPRPYSVWVPGRWEQNGHGWRFDQGHWR